ncbi:aspartyl protease family protein [Flavisolibacter tropicus]|uniref:PDZ domain-containing protein n=1 Tax=Flavisolibacter tropicus TaxID=1492898 RepID=A0A172TWQ4_9BACT|nr:aspartyl protease family protein [Flavisolibacter tropicus]ANE51519.1 hypothetical protein SY85_14410 [Flavisolibacter tropicus]
MLKKAAFLLIYLSVFIPVLKAQTKPLEVLPLKMIGVHTLIELKINNSKPLKFVFDTGAGESALSEEAAEKLGLKNEKITKAMEGAGASAETWASEGNRINIGKTTLDSVTFWVTDLSNLNLKGEKVDGIIGYDLIKNFTALIDIDKQQIKLYPATAFSKISKGTPIDFTLVDNIPVFYATVKTINSAPVSGQFFFDTGAGLGVVLHAPLVTKNALIDKLPVKTTLKFSGLGGAFKAYQTTLESVTFAGFTLKDLPGTLSTATSGTAADSISAGTMGNDILSRFNILISYPLQKISVVPNKRFNNAFNFNVSGLKLRKAKEGYIFIDYVMEQSPAEKAGLKVNDVIVSMNGNNSMSLDEMVSLLSVSNRTITIRVKNKENVEREVSLQTERFY